MNLYKVKYRDGSYDMEQYVASHSVGSAGSIFLNHHSIRNNVLGEENIISVENLGELITSDGGAS